MAVQSVDYAVEAFVWEIFSGRRDEVLISGWLVADQPPLAMNLRFNNPCPVSFPIAAINLPSPDLAANKGPAGANARFHAVIRTGNQQLDATDAHLDVDFGRRRLAIEVGSIFDNGVASSPDMVELLAACESLGDSCEFGFVQRKLGVDQLGLFRFTGSNDPLRLAEAIRADFAGFAEDGDLEAGELLGEWLVKSRRFEFILHTGRFPYAISQADIIRKESIKLRYLARKFLEDIHDAAKVFVRRVEGGDERGMLDLFHALRERGPNRLVWITRADDDNPHGTVREVEEGLFRGYIGHFAPLDRALDNRPDLWIDLLRRVPGILPP